MHILKEKDSKMTANTIQTRKEIEEGLKHGENQYLLVPELRSKAKYWIQFGHVMDAHQAATGFVCCRESLRDCLLCS